MLIISLKANAQAAYKGGSGDGFAMAKVEGVMIGEVNPAFVTIKVFPNPVKGNVFQIIFPEMPDGKVKIRLVDVLGRICFYEETEVFSRSHFVNIPMRLTNGTYFISVKTRDKEEFKDKILLLKE